MIEFKGFKERDALKNIHATNNKADADNAKANPKDLGAGDASTKFMLTKL